jgi:hypothetical protein
VLEQAFWDAISIILVREAIELQDFCQMVQARRGRPA